MAAISRCSARRATSAGSGGAGLVILSSISAIRLSSALSLSATIIKAAPSLVAGGGRVASVMIVGRASGGAGGWLGSVTAAGAGAGTPSVTVPNGTTRKMLLSPNCSTADQLSASAAAPSATAAPTARMSQRRALRRGLTTSASTSMGSPSGSAR
jgi:hypothetical protein